MFISRKEYDEMKERIHKLEMELMILKAKPVAQPIAPTPVPEVPQPVKRDPIKVDVILGKKSPSGHTPESDRYDIRFEYKGVRYWGSFYDEPDKSHPGFNGWSSIKTDHNKSVQIRGNKELEAMWAAVNKSCNQQIHGCGGRNADYVPEDFWSKDSLPFE